MPDGSASAAVASRPRSAARSVQRQQAAPCGLGLGRRRRGGAPGLLPGGERGGDVIDHGGFLEPAGLTAGADGQLAGHRDLVQVEHVNG
jgi:hypothetical protein